MPKWVAILRPLCLEVADSTFSVREREGEREGRERGMHPPHRDLIEKETAIKTEKDGNRKERKADRRRNIREETETQTQRKAYRESERQ